MCPVGEKALEDDRRPAKAQAVTYNEDGERVETSVPLIAKGCLWNVASAEEVGGEVVQKIRVRQKGNQEEN